MPETRVERGLFALGILAIAALGILIAHLWPNTQTLRATPGSVSPPTSSSVPRSHGTSARLSTNRRDASPATTATTRARTTTTGVAPSTVTATTTTAGARPVSLVVTAKADTWLEVRANSAAGPVLYASTLTAGSSKAFHARALWARFGAAGNLSARLDGKAFPLPSGTYDAAFDRHGFRRVGA